MLDELIVESNLPKILGFESGKFRFSSECEEVRVHEAMMSGSMCEEDDVFGVVEGAESDVNMEDLNQLVNETEINRHLDFSNSLHSLHDGTNLICAPAFTCERVLINFRSC